MNTIQRIAFVGNSLPRRCGIATFTTDLQQAVAASALGVQTAIIAMSDVGRDYVYPPAVTFEVREEREEDYRRAADIINTGHFDAVSLQHEFGIFGGEAGAHILLLLEHLRVPVVTTLHTVLEAPDAAQRLVLERIIAMSARVVVMAEKGRDLLVEIYGAKADRIEVIPHGIPDFAFVEPDGAKERLGFADKTVILTFGLLSPNKGIEVMIDAMPAVLESRPDAVYVVLGATHPNLVRDRGESYRESLVVRAAALGLGEHVVFLDQFVDRPTLLEYISMCDIYVTPYLNRTQMTSGTLAYSFGLGKAVVSTPYWHALELLADDRGKLVPFGDAAAMGTEIAALLGNEELHSGMRSRAYAASRPMTWSRTAERYIELFATVAGRPPVARILQLPATGDSRRLPAISIGHLQAMTDDTGLFQHAIHTVPDRSHGYCVDDNARGLLLASSLRGFDAEALPDAMTSTYAAFVQHSFNRDTRRFRNFMAFDRRWLEEQGSEDSHGRTLWALGVAARDDATSPRRDWAAALFAEALPTAEDFASPRAWAFTVLGLNAYCEAKPDDEFALRFRLRLAYRLVALLRQVETADWVWFEEGLAYDNARMCEALIVCGRSTGIAGYAEAGLRALDWLLAQQTSPAGLFRPVGTAGFGEVRQPPRPFDQQPVEAAATVAACLEARKTTGEDRWRAAARTAFAWFHGGNDLGQAMVDIDRGSCRDGLHPDRPNENCGGESVVSYLLAIVDMRRLEGLDVLQPLPSLYRPTRSYHPQFRGRLVASNFPQPAGTLPAT